MPSTQDTLQSITHGTIAGVVSRACTFPNEEIYYRVSMNALKNPPIKIKYSEAIRSTFQLKSLLQIGSVFYKAGFVQTAGRSAANMGVIKYIDDHCKDYSPIKKGLLASAFSVPLETVITSYYEWKKVSLFEKLKQSTQLAFKERLFTPEFARVTTATFIRVGYATMITYCGIQVSIATLKKMVPLQHKENPLIDTVAAGAFAFCAQPAIMPTLNWQTAVFQNPKQSLLKTGKLFFNAQGHKRAFAGSLGRAFCQGPRYAISFGLMKWLKGKPSSNVSETISTESSSPKQKF